MSGTTQNCHVLADFSIIPMGAGTNTTKYIVECQKVLLDSGLNFNLHANGTNLEGNYDQVMCAVRKCIDKMHEMGAPRCDTNIRLNTRTDKSVTMQDSIRVVTDKIAAETNANV
ncbi:YkoF-like protein [Rhizophagus irregularis]|uniref:Thiamine-binding protein domain-containing protein n=3 Tax=Rhizophagus irregularis TaxID=588596 RepID=U9SJK9_RHIID|nr:hypothetical protein GLOIN_2v1721680 [Rhizophagus irregularis DAOM 181602=DAOM 197198]EXX78321.1 Ecm15p [Rhizophagus irregularis DAOM 197198w]PKC06259.1 YkoF-like protein [Rhizophagus irregularis]PKC60426.1 hypothetical protein RhiirA1_425932 [Rhizophagus irregularis]PKK72182.1 YkoF-like protein [Rhizophagus irregularis]PKY26805.1 YkoF-like protein [Rhizophagus irregularis]|eukprot:XP_025166355.1 hypothetical protein GLOIN_2v1721680 [Rhizophagus irregularis DAOM 181602=DAOM 197198]